MKEEGEICKEWSDGSGAFFSVESGGDEIFFDFVREIEFGCNSCNNGNILYVGDY